MAARSTEAIKVNNALRRAVRSAISTLTLMAHDPGRRLAAAGEAFRTPDPEQLEAIEAALAAEAGRGRQAGAGGGAGGGAAEFGRADVAERVAAIGVVAGRGGSEALAALTPLQAAEEPEIAAAAKAAVAEIEREQAMWGAAAERLVRAVARLGAAAGGGGARHHLRGDGRDQHGAWRADHARRLHHLPHPGADPHACARALRLVAADRGAGGLPRRRRDRRGDRARHRALPLRPAAGDAARHLGREPDPAADGAHDLRAVEPRGGQPVVDVGRRSRSARC